MQKIIWIAKVTCDDKCYSCGTSEETISIKYFDNEKSATDWAIGTWLGYVAAADQIDNDYNYNWEVDAEILNS